MPSLVLFVESLIAPHVQVQTGLEHYLIQHKLDWPLAVVTLNKSYPSHDPETFYLSVHARMVPESLRSLLGRPALGLFGQSDHGFHCCLDLNERAFGEMAAQHFHDLGFRQVAYIPSPKDSGRSHFIDYYRGFSAAAKLLRMDMSVLPSGEAGGDIALFTALRRHQKPLGVYCATDGQADWLRDRCLQEGVHIPDEVAILGTSDHPHHCQRMRPGLSSIAFPWYIMGRVLGQAVHQQVSGQERPGAQLLRPLRVVERASTAGVVCTDALVRAALAWLKQHLAEPQPLVACAAAQGCSVPTLARRFRKSMGSSVKQVQARLRHQHAMRLLRESQMTIAGIAQECGYADGAAFSVAFKRLSGWSPGRWRSAAQG